MAKFPPHYSLLNEHAKSFEIHDQRDGKSFHIPKKGLDDSTAKKIKGIQKFDLGGGVEGDDPSSQSQVPSDAPPQTQVSQPQSAQVVVPETPASGKGAPDLTPKVPVPVTVSTPGMSQMSPDQMQSIGRAPQGNAPASPQDMYQQFQNNTDAEVKAQGAMGDARTGELNQQAQNYQSANDKMKQFFDQSQTDLANQNMQNEKLAQEVASAKIDPNHYMASKSTGGKISTALSLVLGGIGSGLTHGPNLGYETLQRAINQDIDAQKENLTNKRSLLSDNLKKYGDMRLAQQATMMQMNAMTQGQIAQTSAKFGAQGNAAATQELQAKMKNDYLFQGQQLKQMINEQKIKEHLAGGDVSGQNPLDYVQHVVPKEEQAKVSDEIGKAQYVTQNHDKLMQLWDQAQKEQTATRTGFGLVDAPATRELRALGDPLIHDQDGRVNEFEKKDYEGLFPSSGQTNGRQKELREGFEQFINNKKQAPKAKSYGIDINRFNSTKTAPNTTIRETRDGKRAMYNADTRQFMGYVP